MPIGIQRINAKHQQPNTRITFIKPLPGPTTKYALDFLERIAAICHPIMLANHLSITTLEEYEPNREFIGRNFDAGEIIQLVLRSSRGQWLSFRTVQMVMMHELAHCMQMNHGRDFWRIRNQYAEELRGLWGRGYTGDGFWGRGKTVSQEDYPGGAVGEGDIGMASLCGGTFRSRRKRRRGDGGVGQNLTYKEKQKRMIAKKFGTNGMTLGDDLDMRVKLEDGKRPKGKPRVARSARGRELRAKAMLARLGVAKEEAAKKEEEVGPSENGSDYEESEDSEALDLNGSRLLDGNGNGMIKVCEDEDKDDVHVKQEIRELQELSDAIPHRPTNLPEAQEDNLAIDSKSDIEAANETNKSTAAMNRDLALSLSAASAAFNAPSPPGHPLHMNMTSTCSICSMTNEPDTTLCVACSHVLDPGRVSGTWRCSSSTCKDSLYINTTDYGLCGLCGCGKPDG